MPMSSVASDHTTTQGPPMTAYSFQASAWRGQSADVNHAGSGQA